MGRKSVASVVWGLILMALGVGFMLDVLNVADFGQIIEKYWPVVFLLIALGQLIDRRYISALIWSIVGIVLQLSALGLITGNVFGILVSLLIIWIGINIVFRSFARSEIKAETDSYVSGTAIFGGSEKRIESSAFHGASLNAIFGGVKLDLRKSKIAQNGGVIDAVVIFGGAEIIVPEGVEVKTDIFALFGGADDKRSKITTGQSKNVLKVQGIVLFGGLEIKD